MRKRKAMPSGDKSDKPGNEELRRVTAPAEIPRRAAMVILAVILCFGAFARFYRLGDKSLWLDEIMSARLARLESPVEVVREVASYDAHPPLFPLLHYLFIGAGDGEFYARTAPALFGILSIFMLYLFAGRLFGRAGGLAAAAMMSLSAYHIYYSQEARQYSLAILLAVTLSWILLVIIDSKDNPPGWTWIVYAITGAALLYTFVMGILLIAGHWAVFLILGDRSKPVLLRGLATQIFIGLSFIPWLGPLTRAQRAVALIASIQGEAPPPGPADVLGALGEWILGGTFLPTGGMLILGLPAAAIFLLGLVSIRRNRRPLIIMACLTILPALVYLVLPMTRAHRFDPKHLAFIFPFVIVTPAALLGAWPKARLAGALVPVCVVIVNIGMVAGYYDPSFQKDVWPDAAEFIQSEGGGDFILVNPGRGAPHALQRYYEGDLKIQAAQVGFAVPVDATLAIEFDRVWLVTCWNEVLSPTAGLIEWFETNTRRVGEEYFINKPEGMYPAYPYRVIRCALYERVER